MVTPLRPRSIPATQKAVQPNNDGCAALGVIIAIVVVVMAAGRCSSDTDNANSSAAANLMNDALSNGIEAQSPPPPEPLAAASITRGVAHLRLAVAAEGFPGAMIYSQNCYDALSRQFSWTKLDLCGGFDMLAVRSAASLEMSGLSSEAAYFESETAAARYLAAATGAGLETGAADARLSELQSRVARLPVPAPRRRDPPPATGAGNDNLDTNEILEAVNAAEDVDSEPVEEVVGE